jgi:hypothetical protein
MLEAADADFTLWRVPARTSLTRRASGSSRLEPMKPAEPVTKMQMLPDLAIGEIQVASLME